MNSSINSNNSSVLINSTLSFLLDFATNATTTTTTSSPPLLLNFSLSTESSKENSQLSPPSSPSLLQSIPDQDYNHSQYSHLKCLPSPSASILFQLSHVLFLIAYLTPTNVLYLPGACGQLAMHSVLALGHLLLTIWVYSSTSGSCYRSLFPTLIGWSVAFFLVNSFRAAILLYSAVVKGRLKVKEVASLYEDLFAPVRVSKRDFSKLISKGRLTELAIGESYAVEGVTETNRLALLVAGKINVMCAGQFLHSINPGEFLDSPEWESSTPSGSSVTGTSANNNCNGSSSKPSGTSGSAAAAAGRKPSLSNNFVAVSTAGRYELFDGTTGKTGKEQFQAEVQQRFNISLIAASVNVQYVLWERPTLEYHLAKEPFMGTVMGLLLARDITNKLYQMNEKFSNERGSQIDIRLPVIINSFSKRTDLTKFLPVTTSSISARPRSLTSTTTTTVRETPLKNVPKTSAAAAAAVAISPLATISTSSRRRGSSNEGQSTAESANYVLPAAVCQQKLNRQSPATTTCSTTQTSHSITTTENSSSDEIFIDIAGKDTTPDEAPALKKFSISEIVKKPEDTDEEEEDDNEDDEEEEYSTSASYAAMSLSEAGSSNWAAPSTLNSFGSDQRSQQFGCRTKKGKRGVHQSPDSTAVNIPLLPKNVIGSSDKRRFY